MRLGGLLQLIALIPFVPFLANAQTFKDLFPKLEPILSPSLANFDIKAWHEMIKRQDNSSDALSSALGLAAEITGLVGESTSLASAANKIANKIQNLGGNDSDSDSDSDDDNDDDDDNDRNDDFTIPSFNRRGPLSQL